MEYTDEQLLKLDPELDALFKKRGIPPLATPTRATVPTFRKIYNATVKRYNKSPMARAALGDAFGNPNWVERDHNVTVRDHRTLKVRTYTPKSVDQSLAPVFVEIHGGGWFMGDLDTESLWCRILASKLGFVVVSVDYGLYPDVKFPVPITDCFDAVKWVARMAASFGGDPRQGFIIGGNSGGATYASILTHLARDEGLDPPITGNFMSCPILTDEYVGEDGVLACRYDRETEFRSWVQNKNAPLTNEEMRHSIKDLASFDQSAFLPTSTMMTPFNFESHKQLPPTYVQVCGLDLWRDAGIMYGKELEKENVKTKLDVYPGLPHCWWTTFPHLKATKQWLEDCINGVQWLVNTHTRSAGSSKL